LNEQFQELITIKMKTIVTYLLALILVLGFKGVAQDKNALRLVDKPSTKGSRELKKEMRVKHRSQQNAKAQARKAMKKNKVSKYTVGPVKKLKPRKGKKVKTETIDNTKSTKNGE
jgi:hypothetical protein